jgi:hypothetical protein
MEAEVKYFLTNRLLEDEDEFGFLLGVNLETDILGVVFKGINQVFDYFIQGLVAGKSFCM